MQGQAGGQRRVAWQHGVTMAVEIDTPLVETERLVVRPWRPDEVERLYDIYRRDEVVRWLGGAALTTVAEAETMLARGRERIAADPRFGVWAVAERDAAAPAGSVLLKALPDGNGEIEIGWHLHPDSWGRGLATEAASALLAHGFTLGLGEIWAVTNLDNHPSANVCRRLGMRELGLTHRWYHQPLRMFWAAAGDGQAPTIAPDGPVPGQGRS